MTSGCELDFVCSPCSKKEQTHRSEADIDVDDFAANWEMGFDISDGHQLNYSTTIVPLVWGRNDQVRNDQGGNVLGAK